MTVADGDYADRETAPRRAAQMQARYHRITDDRLLRPQEAHGIAPEWARARVHRWVDVQGATEEELAALLAPLQLHPLVLDGLLDEGRNARIAPFESAVFFELPTLPEDEQSRHISIVCLPSLLITVHRHAVSRLDGLACALESDMRLVTPTVRALVYQVLDDQIDETLHRGMALRCEVETLSRQLDQTLDDVGVESIVQTKGRLSAMSAVCEDQLYCIEALMSAQSAAFSVGPQRDHFNDLAGHLEHALRTLTRLEAHLNELRLYYLLAVQERTEKRLGTLTVISAVFLPLTLLSGIYGMNFASMPGLAEPAGFWAMLGLMGLIGAGLLVYFRARGWFE